MTRTLGKNSDSDDTDPQAPSPPSDSARSQAAASADSDLRNNHHGICQIHFSGSSSLASSGPSHLQILINLKAAARDTVPAGALADSANLAKLECASALPGRRRHQPAALSIIAARTLRPASR
jgi:hypothetical protein